MSAHTPGPWFIGSDENEIDAPDPINPSLPWYIATAHRYVGIEDEDQMSANARLIAAAPDLLAACEQLLATEQGVGPYEWERARIAARAAIAKAKGE